MTNVLIFIYVTSFLILCYGLAKSEGGCRLETIMVVVLMVTPVLNTLIAVGYLKELYNEHH